MSAVSLDGAIAVFFGESRELLEQVERCLLQLEQDPRDTETLRELFRAAHTLKGSAGLFGLEQVVAFAHEMESVLDLAREGRLPLDARLVELLLQSADHIRQLLEAAQTGGQGGAAGAPPAKSAQCLDETLVRQLRALGAGPVHTHRDSAEDTWQISLRFNPDVLRHGMDPAGFIRYLTTFGEIVHAETLHDALPSLPELDPESCYLAFELRYRTEADQAAIEAAFEFVREDCSLRIVPPGGALTPKELEQQSVKPDPVRERQTQSQESAFIRVRADKLDALINQIGELVIAGAGVGMQVQRNAHAALKEALSSMSRMVEEVHERAMCLRMVPIGETFARFKRVVRDVSKELGKEIELTITGADTEIDKLVAERMSDALMHMVRNSIDHGIEATAIRTSRGKSPVGKLQLKACHESGGILLEVSDDGGGLDRERILKKAVERGLIAADASAVCDNQVWGLIFEPGFSTAERVSNLSGRGVGLDVVKRSIEALRGDIEIESRLGEGTTFRIRLPLTLAVIDGFLMKAAGTHFVVPLDRVIECIEIDGASAASRRDFIDLRGEVLPLLRVREHFGLQAPPPRRQNVVVVQSLERRAGLVVDQLEGELQAVIKPLGRLFQSAKGLSGSTILGSGEVALLLEVTHLLEAAVARAAAAASQEHLCFAK